MKRLLAALALTASFLTAAPAATAQTGCQYVLGFAALHDLAPNDVGDCQDDQAFAPNGDALQHTSRGLMAWRKADNWTAFTDGYRTWLNGPAGLAVRLNTQQFSWEGGATAAPAPAPVAPSATAPSASRAPVAAAAPPAGATFQCKDGDYSFARTSQGACSSHGGIGVRL